VTFCLATAADVIKLLPQPHLPCVGDDEVGDAVVVPGFEPFRNCQVLQVVGVARVLGRKQNCVRSNRKKKKQQNETIMRAFRPRL
jgi:hypothetical protein